MPISPKNSSPTVRTGQGESFLSRQEFERRYRASFFDPAFDEKREDIEQLLQIAWEAYKDARKSPKTRKAGPEFADPDYDISVEWLASRQKIQQAQQNQEDASKPSRVLLVCASPRNDKTCPGEMSKTYRLAQVAKDILDRQILQVDLLDLSELTSEYRKVIYPCKACVSTAMPLCHWPCSCYPNHSLGQVDDWMTDVYPRWVAAHGVMIITPVHWYQAPSVLKLMIDRLVCANGGNPDPSSTHGKKAAEAKLIDFNGWDYPQHLAGRSYSVIVHGDAAGTEVLRRELSDWLNDLGLVQAGNAACLDRFIDYYGPYATSHEALDKDENLKKEVENAAQSLANHIQLRRAGAKEPDAGLTDPRPK